MTAAMASTTRFQFFAATFNCAPRRREPIILGLAFRLGKAPFGRDPTAPLHAVQRGIKGAFLNGQEIVAGLLNAVGDGVTVQRAAGKRFQHQHVQGPLDEVAFFAWFGHCRSFPKNV